MIFVWQLLVIAWRILVIVLVVNRILFQFLENAKNLRFFELFMVRTHRKCWGVVRWIFCGVMLNNLRCVERTCCFRLPWIILVVEREVVLIKLLLWLFFPASLQKLKLILLFLVTELYRMLNFMLIKLVVRKYNALKILRILLSLIHLYFYTFFGWAVRHNNFRYFFFSLFMPLHSGTKRRSLTFFLLWSPKSQKYH
jgi:hypothetical protein